jgi:hypothetical protein
MKPALFAEIISGLHDGSVVPCLGPGVLADACAPATRQSMPASNDALIGRIIDEFNGGQPLESRLMHEFSRAAMHVEHEYSRAALNDFLNRIYLHTRWQRAALHEWLANILPPFVIDLNRDTQLLESYATAPHYLVRGRARLSGLGKRYDLFLFTGTDYVAIEPEQACERLPALFKPMGTPIPWPGYVAADADYVDYMTELKGRFGMPDFLREKHKNRRYLLLGLRLNRDTERMILGELTSAAAAQAGWAFLPEATAKERRFLERHRITLIEEDFQLMLPGKTGAPAIASTIRHDAPLYP